VESPPFLYSRFNDSVFTPGHDIRRFKAFAQDGEIHLSQVQLHPTHQHRGIATDLIQRLQRQAAGKGLPITLHVLKRNRAIRLYARLGFVMLREEEHSYTMGWERSASQFDEL
jgi:ribosomal protein S18 acetylase RimI-like enzyme